MLHAPPRTAVAQISAASVGQYLLMLTHPAAAELLGQPAAGTKSTASGTWHTELAIGLSNEILSMPSVAKDLCKLWPHVHLDKARPPRARSGRASRQRARPPQPTSCAGRAEL